MGPLDPMDHKGKTKPPTLLLYRILSQVAQVVKNHLPMQEMQAGDSGLVSRWERSPGRGNGNPLQYSYLENPMDKEPGGLQPMGLQRVGHDLKTGHK